MILNTLKKNKILFFILLFLFLIVLIISTKKPDKPTLIKTKIKQENKAVKPKPIPSKEPLQITKIKQKSKLIHTPLKTLILDDKIDFIGKDNPLIYSKPKLEIDQMIDIHKNINTFEKEKDLKEKKEDWKMNYELGLEDGAIENIKTKGTLKSEMFNGKVGFSKSF